MTVSIIIATYGSQEWQDLAQTRALPSAEAQNPAEIVVGHSTEGTVANIRNKLGEKAKSDWLCFLDADDELDPGYLAAMDKARPHARGFYLLMPAVSYVHRTRRKKPMMRPVTSLTHDNFLVIGTLVQRKLFLKVGGFSDYPHGFEDWSLWAKCWKAGAKIVQVPDAVYVAYINPRSKHRRMWGNRTWQVETHNRVQAELFPEQS